MDISHIISLYSKQDVIPFTLKSIMQQEGNLARELILLDDNSKDNTAAVAAEVTSNFAHVKIVRNADNKGPSYRLNQGAKLASGKYLHFFDHDDILPENAAKFMFDIMEESGADFVYGAWHKIAKPPQEILGTKITENLVYEISGNPLETVLNGKFKRMCVLVKKEVFERAGGFDDAVFIQDESLPLRLALASKKMAITKAFVNLVPKGEGNLSESKVQLNHDRFMAYYNFYQKCPHPIVFKRAVSAAWKEKRANKKYAFFLKYICTRFLPKEKTLARLKKYFDAQKVLRPYTNSQSN